MTENALNDCESDGSFPLSRNIAIELKHGAPMDQQIKQSLASKHPFFGVPYYHTARPIFEFQTSKVFTSIGRCGATICSISYPFAQWTFNGGTVPLYHRTSTKRTSVFGHFSSHASKFHGSFYYEMTTSFVGPNGS